MIEYIIIGALSVFCILLIRRLDKVFHRFNQMVEIADLQSEIIGKIRKQLKENTNENHQCEVSVSSERERDRDSLGTTRQVRG